MGFVIEPLTPGMLVQREDDLYKLLDPNAIPGSSA
jgi:hypothetical protein